VCPRRRGQPRREARPLYRRGAGNVRGTERNSRTLASVVSFVRVKAPCGHHVLRSSSFVEATEHRSWPSPDDSVPLAPPAAPQSQRLPSPARSPVISTRLRGGLRSDQRRSHGSLWHCQGVHSSGRTPNHSSSALRGAHRGALWESPSQRTVSLALCASRRQHGTRQKCVDRQHVQGSSHCIRSPRIVRSPRIFCAASPTALAQCPITSPRSTGARS
jgi:hypothetical protein